MDYQTKLPKFLLELLLLLHSGLEVTAGDPVYKGLQPSRQEEFLCMWHYKILPGQTSCCSREFSFASTACLKVICIFTGLFIIPHQIVSCFCQYFILPTLQSSWILMNWLTRLWRCPLQCHVRPSLLPSWRNLTIKGRWSHWSYQKTPTQPENTKKTKQPPHTHFSEASGLWLVQTVALFRQVGLV